VGEKATSKSTTALGNSASAVTDNVVTLSGRCSLIKALELLAPDFTPMEAAAKIEQAIHEDDRFPLYCNGKTVKANIRAIAKVVPEPKEDGSWTADIVSTGPGLGWAPGAYNWELEVDAVLALKPQPDTRAESAQATAMSAMQMAEAAAAEAASAQAEAEKARTEMEQARAERQTAAERMERAEARLEAAEARVEAMKALPIKVQLPGKVKVQLVEKSAPRRAKGQAPSQLTEDQIQALMGDVSELSDLKKKIRRYAVKKYRERWRDVDPADVRKNAEGNKLYEEEVGALHHITTFRRALGRKK
jgi:hypothetical protein